jgi:hypothetical protein
MGSRVLGPVQSFLKEWLCPGTIPGVIQAPPPQCPPKCITEVPLLLLGIHSCRLGWLLLWFCLHCDPYGRRGQPFCWGLSALLLVALFLPLTHVRVTCRGETDKIWSRLSLWKAWHTAVAPRELFALAVSYGMSWKSVWQPCRPADLYLP